MCFGIILYHLRINIVLNRLKTSQKKNHQLFEKIVNELLKTKLCADGLHCKYRNFFLNAYWLKSGWVFLINYVFLTSYLISKDSFLNRLFWGYAVNRVYYLRKDALKGFDVCIGSAQMKKMCALGLQSKKKGCSGLNAYLQNQSTRRLVCWGVFRVCSSCFWWEIAWLLVVLKKIRWKFAGKIEFGTR